MDSITRRCNKGEMVYLGTAEDGSPLLLSRATDEHVELVQGDTLRFWFLPMANHEFARFVGGLHSDSQGWGPFATVEEKGQIRFERQWENFPINTLPKGSEFKLYRPSDEALPSIWIVL